MLTTNVAVDCGIGRSPAILCGFIPAVEMVICGFIGTFSNILRKYLKFRFIG